MRSRRLAEPKPPQTTLAAGLVLWSTVKLSFRTTHNFVLIAPNDEPVRPCVSRANRPMTAKNLYAKQTVSRRAALFTGETRVRRAFTYARGRDHSNLDVRQDGAQGASRTCDLKPK